MSGLTEPDFAPALAQLLDYSLLEVVDPLGAPRYSLHRLTAAFLRTDVLRQWAAWLESASPEQPPHLPTTGV